MQYMHFLLFSKSSYWNRTEYNLILMLVTNYYKNQEQED